MTKTFYTLPQVREMFQDSESNAAKVSNSVDYAILDGRLTAREFDGQTIILVEDLQEFLRGLPKAGWLPKMVGTGWVWRQQFAKDTRNTRSVTEELGKLRATMLGLMAIHDFDEEDIKAIERMIEKGMPRAASA